MGKISLKIPGIVIGILPIPMYHFIYHEYFYETSSFMCDFMKLHNYSGNTIFFLCSFKNLINKKYWLCLTGKPWPEPILV